MAQKPEIQYVGQFYVHGSEARELARKQQKEQRKAKTTLPLHRFERVSKVYVDPLAIGSILVAAVLLVTVVMGTLGLQTAWEDLETAQEYVYQLEKNHRILVNDYRSGYDLEEVRAAALEMGLIPASEAAVRSIHVTVPVQQPESTWIDDLMWFLDGLFA